MSIRSIGALLPLLLFISCASSDEGLGPQLPKKTTYIRSGTGFGHCHGYCMTELYLDSTTAIFVESSRESEKFPEKSERVEIGVGTWSNLAHAADTSRIMALDSVIGCPDCADGGSEWIEVRSIHGIKRVVFPYGASVPEIDPLLEQIRAIRQRFRE